MKRFLICWFCLSIFGAHQLTAQGASPFSVEEEVRQLSVLLQLDRTKATEVRAVAARYAARAAGLDQRTDRRAYRTLKDEKLDALQNVLGPDEMEQYKDWLDAGNPLFSSLSGSTAVAAINQSEIGPSSQSINEGISPSRPPTANGMAETQADYMVRRLGLSEEQRAKIVEMYEDFNRDFDRRREQQEGTDITGMQTILRNQQTKRDRVLKRVLSPEQFQQYLILEGRAEE